MIALLIKTLTEFDFLRYTHPNISTVSYFTSGGAPTLIIPNEISKTGDVKTGEISEALRLSLPNFNKHIAFDGKYLHGVVPELGTEETAVSKNSRNII